MILLAGGDDETRSTASPRRVVAAFYPLAFAAEQVGGPDLDVENLTPPGTEPHDLEVTPADVADVQDADLVLLMGHDFQPQLEQAAEDADGTVLEVLDDPGLDLQPDDPHVWLDPIRYKRVVAAIAAGLGDESDAAPFLNRLDALDAEYRKGLANCKRDEIVTSHEAFAYLAERYGLRQVAILGLSPEAEPTPSELTDVIDEVRDSGATTVFGETLLSTKLAETVARETGAQTAVLNPLEGLTPDQQDAGDDYFSVMRENLAALRTGLGCR